MLGQLKASRIDFRFNKVEYISNKRLLADVNVSAVGNVPLTELHLNYLSVFNSSQKTFSMKKA